MSDPLGPARQVWAGRASARSAMDLLYIVYLTVMTVLVFGAPALRSAGLFLARPDVLPVLLDARTPGMLMAALLGGGAATVLVGAVRGPALLAPFLTATLAAGPISRRRVLWRPLARSLLALVAAGLLLAGVVGATLLGAGYAEPMGLVALGAVAAGVALLLGGAWLAGQLLSSRGRGVVAGLLTLAAVGAWLLPPWGWTLADGVPWALAAVLGGAGAVAAAGSVLALDRLRGWVLLEQAVRWQSATGMVTSGDVAGAAGSLRPPPSTGRSLRAVGGGPLMLLYVRRDVVGWLRSPERTLGGLAGVLLGAGLLVVAQVLTGPLGVGAMLLGSLALWVGTGPFVDGIRHGVATLGAPVLFGQRAGVQVLLHALAPTGVLMLGALAGGVAGLLALGAEGVGGGNVTLPVLMVPVLLPVLLVPALVAGRARDAAKGPMPLKLMTPMPTAQGDGAVLGVLAWQSDAVLLALAAGAVLWGLVTQVGALALAGGALVAVLAIAVMARARLRELGA